LREWLARVHALTEIHNLRGKLLGTIERAGDNQNWTNGASLECWVYKTPRGWMAGLTHNTLGGAVATGTNRWKMWKGTKHAGSATRISSTRWTIFNPKGDNVGYAVGPDGGAAATAYLITGICQ
jgi:hypothetical protein